MPIIHICKSLLHNEQLLQHLLAEQVEECGHVGEEVEASVDLGVADLVEDGLVGEVVEALPALDHLVGQDLVDHRVDLLQAVQVALREGALRYLGLDVGLAGVGGLFDLGYLLDDVEQSDLVLAVPEDDILEVGDGDHFDGLDHEAGVISKGIHDITEIRLHELVVTLMLLVDLQ